MLDIYLLLYIGFVLIYALIYIIMQRVAVDVLQKEVDSASDKFEEILDLINEFSSELIKAKKGE